MSTKIVPIVPIESVLIAEGNSISSAMVKESDTLIQSESISFGYAESDDVYTNLDGIKQPSCAKNWCFTWHYKNESSIVPKFQELCNLGHLCIFGYEITPTTSRLHIQGYVSFKNKCRPRGLMDLDVRWFKCKGTKKQNIVYCGKGGDYLTNIPGVKDILLAEQSLVTRDPLDGKEFYEWQKEVIEVIKGPVDDRKIYWFWEPNGNMGKTSFAKHVMLKYGGIFLSGKGADQEWCY